MLQGYAEFGKLAKCASCNDGAKIGHRPDAQFRVQTLNPLGTRAREAGQLYEGRWRTSFGRIQKFQMRRLADFHDLAGQVSADIMRRIHRPVLMPIKSCQGRRNQEITIAGRCVDPLPSLPHVRPSLIWLCTSWTFP